MKLKLPKAFTGNAVDKARRRLLGGAVAGGGLLALTATRSQAQEGNENLRFPGDPADHKVVYQFNKADQDYQNHVLFSVGAMVRKYGDNISIVVTCFGPGLHILAKKPKRLVTDEIKERVASLNVYGVAFHACGNTLKSLGWSKDDLVPFAEVVEVGAADLMTLQEQGYTYISW